MPTYISCKELHVNPFVTEGKYVGFALILEHFSTCTRSVYFLFFIFGFFTYFFERAAIFEH